MPITLATPISGPVVVATTIDWADDPFGPQIVR